MDEHICTTSDGLRIVCFCIRGVDHNEDEFDIPIEDDDEG